MEEDDFTSMASHAFRSLLAVIDGNAQRMIARGESLTPLELLDRTQRIRGAVRGMTQLIDELMRSSGSNPECRGRPYNPAEVDLAMVLQEVCDLQLELTPEANIRLSLGPETVRVWGDAALLRQVFGNIVSNAVRYSTGAADIDVSCLTEAATVTVLIQDGGVGIPPNELARIFDPYYQCSNVTGSEGQGLGLYVVKKIVDLHRGTTTVRNRPDGPGSMFAVCLPRAARIS